MKSYKKNKIDLTRFPNVEGTWHWVYFADLGNGTTEIGHSKNLRATMHRYVATDEDCQGVWISKPFGASQPKKQEPSPFVGQLLDDWEMGYFSCLEFANRATAGKVPGSETRFLVLPIRCVIGWATYAGLGPGTHYIFNE